MLTLFGCGGGALGTGRALFNFGSGPGCGLLASAAARVTHQLSVVPAVLGYFV